MTTLFAYFRQETGEPVCREVPAHIKYKDVFNWANEQYPEWNLLNISNYSQGEDLYCKGYYDDHYDYPYDIDEENY